MSCPLKFFVWFACLLFIKAEVIAQSPAAESSEKGEPSFSEQNLPDLLALVANSNCVAVQINLEGSVLWTAPAQNELFLHTTAGVLRVKMDLHNQPVPSLGQHVRLTGSASAGADCLDEAVVDNDGLHSLTEKSGSIYLSKGFHPLRLQWFNGKADFALSVNYAGPGIKRQNIPGSRLFHKSDENVSGAGDWLGGLRYRCFEGEWELLPSWRNAVPLKTGTVTNFDLGARTQDVGVGLEFTGALQIEKPGTYTFWTSSDDGSRMFIGSTPLQLEEMETVSLPKPLSFEPGQPLDSKQNYFWGVFEGTVTEVHVDPNGALIMELTAGHNHMYVIAKSSMLESPQLFSRIRVTGLCMPALTDNKTLVAGRLLISDASQIEHLSSNLPSPIAQVHVATTLQELRHEAINGQRIGSAVCLTGLVLTATSPKGFFGFQDQTGGVLVKLANDDTTVVPGRLVVLTGYGALDDNVLYLTGGALVDNDGLHLRREMNAATYLRVGKHPIHLSWFNRANPSALEIYYQGPSVRRQKLPNDALIRPEMGADGETIKWVQGLNYLCYVGDWQQVPGVAQLNPAESGVYSNFKTRGANRSDKIDLEYNGYLNIPKDGEYYFSTISDDGSLLFLDEQVPRVTPIGVETLPAAMRIASRQILSPDQNNHWAEVEGKVNFAYQQGEALILELGSDYGLIRVEIADSTGSASQLLLGSQVKVTGFCQIGLLPSGQGIAANLYTPGMKQLEVTDFFPSQWNRYPVEPIGAAISRSISPDVESIFHARGIPRYNPERHEFDFTDSTGTIQLDPVQPLSSDVAEPMEFIGRLKRTDAGVALQCAIGRKLVATAREGLNSLPLLTSIIKIKQLSREQAQLGYPVKIRGIITLVRGTGTGFIIQDDTSAIDVWWSPYSSTSLPRVGDEWEVEGKTFAEFSPNIRITRARRLGVGAMPEPLHPTWDQLVNGSLDTRYVEIQGVVVRADDNGLTLFTGNGRVQVISTSPAVDSGVRLENSVVRIRGCVIPIRDARSQQVQIGQFRIGNMSINVDEPAPADLFDIGLKHVPDLLLFDARAAALQWVRIRGQFLYQQNRELFIADGTNSLRVIPRDPIDLKPGDIVDAVGFPKLSGRTPVLQEAMLRQVGKAPLPEPLSVPGRSLFTNTYDGRLISVKARVIGTTSNMWEKILELQSGERIFWAKLKNENGVLANLVPGSLVQLDGLYSEQDVRWISGKPDVSFELLLNSPSAVRVLKLPPWWTLRKAFIFIGGMTFVILATLLWIFLLRRRVEERTEQLGREIHHREQLQRQSELEKERSRIARDMHDQLGANVTQIGLLAELTKKNLGTPNELKANAEKISRTAFNIGQGLDEIVWAVNPRNDSLNKFCDYMAVQAHELFQLTHVLCRVDLPPDMPDHALNAEVRHHLLLAAKEALNNVARHANAREVWVRFKLADGSFKISVVDDGDGFDLDKMHTQRNGLQNMQKRMEDIGGLFSVASRPKHGTEVTLTIKLNPPAANGS